MRTPCFLVMGNQVENAADNGGIWPSFLDQWMNPSARSCWRASSCAPFE